MKVLLFLGGSSMILVLACALSVALASPAFAAEIPQCSGLLPYRGVLYFRSEVPEVPTAPRLNSKPFRSGRKTCRR